MHFSSIVTRRSSPESAPPAPSIHSHYLLISAYISIVVVGWELDVELVMVWDWRKVRRRGETEWEK